MLVAGRYYDDKPKKKEGRSLGQQRKINVSTTNDLKQMTNTKQIAIDIAKEYLKRLSRYYDEN